MNRGTEPLLCWSSACCCCVVLVESTKGNGHGLGHADAVHASKSCPGAFLGFVRQLGAEFPGRRKLQARSARAGTVCERKRKERRPVGGKGGGGTSDQERVLEHHLSGEGRSRERLGGRVEKKESSWKGMEAVAFSSALRRPGQSHRGRRGSGSGMVTTGILFDPSCRSRCRLPLPFPRPQSQPGGPAGPRPQSTTESC